MVVAEGLATVLGMRHYSDEAEAAAVIELVKLAREEERERIVGDYLGLLLLTVRDSPEPIPAEIVESLNRSFEERFHSGGSEAIYEWYRELSRE